MKLINSARFTALLDANVMYPVVVRDFLMWLSLKEMYTPKWSGKLIEEFTEIFRKKQSSYPEDKIKKQVFFMNKANPEAMVEDYEELIPSIELPDKNDRHVVAAAIKCDANVIVTYNLKDFPKEYLRKFRLTAEGPDTFIANMIDLAPEKCCEAFREMVLYKKNPPFTEDEYLEILRKNSLEQTVSELEKYLNLSDS